VAERQAHAQQHPVNSRFGQCRYSISIGVAAWQGGESFDQLCRRADQALYHAKNTGRNRVPTEQGAVSTTGWPDKSIIPLGLKLRQTELMQ
jgi:diguanylate cyclase (GGDEF)-like protein